MTYEVRSSVAGEEDWTVYDGETFEHYLVQYRSTGSSTWTDQGDQLTATSVTIDDLDVGVKYDFRVGVVSDQGTAWSEVVTRQASRPTSTPKDPEPTPDERGELPKPVSGSGQVTVDGSSDEAATIISGST